MLLNVSIVARNWLIDNGHTIIGILSVCCVYDKTGGACSKEGEETSVYGFSSLSVIALEDSVHVGSDETERRRRLVLLQRLMEEIVQPLKMYHRQGFVVQTRDGKGVKCVPLVA